MRLISVIDEELATLMHYGPAAATGRSLCISPRRCRRATSAPGMEYGVITRIARETQRKYRRPQDLAHGASKYS
jgi:hypothetical protein